LPLDLRGPPRQLAAAKPAVDPEQGLRVAHRALAEIDHVQHTVVEMQKDLGRLKETVGQRDAQDREAQSRLAALEERVTTLQTPAPTVVSVPADKQRAAEKAKTVAEKRTAEKRANPRLISVGEEQKPERPAAVDQGSPQLQTGSIPAAPPAIAFGAPEVTPVRQSYTVQIGAGPSLDALRMAWLVLRDQHGGALRSLQPRFVAPKGGSGPYRLVAGPLPSKADADKVCAEMGVGREGCFATTVMGQPL
jgi:Tfp pilus assembly protein FimV